MALKTKADIAALKDLSSEDRADITSLFDAIEANNAEVTTLRKKSGDADEVVKKNKDLEKLLKEKETLSSELKAKLDALTITAPAKTESFDDLLPFAEIRKDLEDLFGSDEPAAPDA